MKRRYSLEWILVRLLIGAVLALAAENVRAQTSPVCGPNGYQQPKFTGMISVSFGSDVPNGTQVNFKVSDNPSGAPAYYGALWSATKGGSGIATIYSGAQNFSNPCSGGVTIRAGGADGKDEGHTYNVSGSVGLTFATDINYLGGWADYYVPLSVHIGAGGGCVDGVVVKAHWSSAAPHAAGVVVNLVVGGFLAQIQCDANGCNQGVIPGPQLTATGGAGPYSVDGGIQSGSWTICGVTGSRETKTPVMGAIPSTVDCGDTVDVPIDSGCPNPSPSPSATASPSPSASVAQSPSTTPVITPPPAPSPLTFSTPPPNEPGTSVTHGGTTGSGISNQDIYNDVKQALQDAGNTGEWYGVNGGFSYGTDPSGENGSAGTGLQDAVNRFTNDLEHGGSDSIMGKVDAIDSLDLPISLGEKSSWAVSLPVLGDITVDTTPYDTPVGILRALCLAILIVCGWFAMIRIIRSGVA